MYYADKATMNILLVAAVAIGGEGGFKAGWRSGGVFDSPKVLRFSIDINSEFRGVFWVWFLFGDSGRVCERKSRGL